MTPSLVDLRRDAARFLGGPGSETRWHANERARTAVRSSQCNAGTIASVRLSQRFVRVLLAVTAASIVVAAHVPAATSIGSSDRVSHSIASAIAGRFEAPLAQLKSLDERQLRSDNDTRGIELGVIASTAALAAGGLVSIVRRFSTQRFEPARRGGVRVRAPPSCSRALT